VAPTTLVGRVRATGRVCRPGERAGRVPLAYAGRARVRAGRGIPLGKHHHMRRWGDPGGEHHLMRGW